MWYMYQCHIYRTDFKSDFSNYILPIPVICRVALHSYTNLLLCSDSSFHSKEKVSAQVCTSLYTAWARLGLLLEMNWHNELALCQFISKSSPRRAQAVYKLVPLCTDLLFVVFCGDTLVAVQQYRACVA